MKTRRIKLKFMIDPNHLLTHCYVPSPVRVRIVGGEVRTDHRPTLPTVARAVHMLAANVDPGVVVRRNRNGEGPLEAIPERRGGPPLGIVGPNAHVARMSGPVIVALENSLVAARPYDVVVDRVRYRESRFTSPNGVPLTDGDSGA